MRPRVNGRLWSAGQGVHSSLHAAVPEDRWRSLDDLQGQEGETGLYGQRTLQQSCVFNHDTIINAEEQLMDALWMIET